MDLLAVRRALAISMNTVGFRYRPVSLSAFRLPLDQRLAGSVSRGVVRQPAHINGNAMDVFPGTSRLSRSGRPPARSTWAA